MVLGFPDTNRDYRSLVSKNPTHVGDALQIVHRSIRSWLSVTCNITQTVECFIIITQMHSTFARYLLLEGRVRQK